MIVIVEGCDRCGKSTQIAYMQKKFERDGKAVFIIHCEAVKAYSKDEAKIDYIECNHWVSTKRYAGLLKMIEKYADDPDTVIIFDRAHIGEAVYSPLYRNYDGNEVFAMENMISYEKAKLVHLFIMIDDAENIIARDDGLSFSIDKDIKKKEIDLFIQAWNKSRFSSNVGSRLINIKDKNIEDVSHIIEGALNA